MNRRKRKIRTLDSPPYILDTGIHDRFDQRRTVFGRVSMDSSASFFRRNMYENVDKIVARGEKGYSRMEFARTMGAWTVYDYFHGAFSRERLEAPNSVFSRPVLDRYPVDDREKMTREVKETARRFGASSTGICELNQKWIYSTDLNDRPVAIPEGCSYVIVMAIAMDGQSIANSPGFPACTATGVGYSHMAFSIACMAEFIRFLGYRAIPSGNDTALSIPLAVDAGLGELGRNGLLITPEYGPCVRICKVFTDLPVLPDRPIEFGVNEFCMHCDRCADACEADAIPREIEPSFDIVCPSNNRGILRWAIHHDRCFEFWVENGGDCSNCIAACPYMRDGVCTGETAN
jgi:hypothetical protein